MRVLFSLLSRGFLKNFESAIEELARRGHEVDVLVHHGSGLVGVDDLSARLEAQWPNVRIADAPPVDDPWPAVSIALRACHDNLYFADERFGQAYWARAWARTPRKFRPVAKLLPLRTRFGRRAGRAALLGLEERMPLSPAVVAELRRRAPDVALFSPLIGLGTVQPHWLRAARSLGIPSAACVASWDHLTSKTLIRPLPDIVTVWNATQADEAATLHDVPRERIEITGAQLFDHWFDWTPRPREEFCAAAGLDPVKPVLLYTCFSPFKNAPPEVGFVRRWIEAVRSHPDERVRGAALLIRPHPKRLRQWDGVDLSEYGDVAIWPRDGRFMSDAESKADFFDSLFHSEAVVGLNTSAMIEAAIVGRPVFAILAPEYRSSQLETLHFRYLLEVGGGAVRPADGLDEHLDQLAEARRGERDGSAAVQFVREFVRPHGLDVPGTGRLADAVERLAAAPAPEPTPRRLDSALRVLLGAAMRRATRKRPVAAAAAAREETVVEPVPEGAMTP